MTLWRTTLGSAAAVTVGQVMALAAVNLLYGLSVYVLLILRSGMALPALQSLSVHRVLVRLDRYTEPALPACLAVAPDTVFGLIAQGRRDIR
jgi:hypothetical protein